MNIEKINNSQWDMNYASVLFVIQWINSTSFDCCDKNAVYKPDKSNI